MIHAYIDTHTHTHTHTHTRTHARTQSHLYLKILNDNLRKDTLVID